MSWLIYILVLLAYLLLILISFIFKSRLNELDNSIKHNRYRDDDHIQKIETNINSINTKLEHIKNLKLEENLKIMEEINKQLNSIKKTEPVYNNQPVADIPPTNKEKPIKDDKIWVWRTEEGLKKLKPIDYQRNIYLCKRGNDYLLYLDDLQNSNINDIIRLYGEIIDFPPKLQFNDQIIMKKNPLYEKQGIYFIFRTKGEIAIQ